MIQSYKYIAVKVPLQLYSLLSRNTLVFWFIAISSLSYNLLEKPVVSRENKSIIWCGDLSQIRDYSSISGSVQLSKNKMGQSEVSAPADLTKPFYPKFNIN